MKLWGKQRHQGFHDWVAFGMDKGWVGHMVCHTHDGVPTSAEEDHTFDEGDDPCLWMFRVYESSEHKLAVEENHSPSRWRKPPAH